MKCPECGVKMKEINSHLDSNKGWYYCSKRDCNQKSVRKSKNEMICEQVFRGLR